MTKNKAVKKALKILKLKNKKHPYQKFHKNDLVYVTKNLPSEMSHFQCGTYALIVESSDDSREIITEETPTYTLQFLDCIDNESSWYDEKYLTLITKAENLNKRK